MDKHTLRMGEERIPKLIIRMAVPAIISMMVQALYNIVDSIFVASISEQALTALSLAFPIQIIMIALFVGLGMGLNSVISRRLGEKRIDEAVNSAEHGFLLAFIIWAIIAVTAIFLPEWFFGFFTNDPDIIEYATQYTTIVMIFSFGFVFSQVCMSIMQATGNMVSSMTIQLIGAILNLILDPIFIFAFGLGVKGAAIATVLGQITAMLFAFFLLFIKGKGLKLNLKKFHFNPQITKNILAVGFPSMIVQGLGSVMITGINLILGGFGETSIAVFGAYFKVQSLIFMPVFGLGQGTMPITGYNYGAKNKKRVLHAVRFSSLAAFGIMTLGTIIFQAFPSALLKMFSSTPEMMAIGMPAFRILSSVFPFAAFMIMLNMSLQAIGDAYKSMIVSFARQIVVLLPVAWLLSRTMQETGVWLAFPIAEVSSLIITTIFVVTTYHKKIKHLGEPNNEELTAQSVPDMAE